VIGELVGEGGSPWSGLSDHELPTDADWRFGGRLGETPKFLGNTVRLTRLEDLELAAVVGRGADKQPAVALAR
jgi:hypothetical protein